MTRRSMEAVQAVNDRIAGIRTDGSLDNSH
jgi:hypothetical protein